MVTSSDLLPTSEDVLLRLAVAILPSASEPTPKRYELEFLHALFDLRYQREPEIDLGRAFFDYFCRDTDNGIVADLLKQYPDCEDIVSDRLESYYSDVEADPQTGEPRGVPEFGIGSSPKTPATVQPEVNSQHAQRVAELDRRYHEQLVEEYREKYNRPASYPIVAYTRSDERVVIVEPGNVWIHDIESDDDGIWRFRDNEGKVISWEMSPEIIAMQIEWGEL